MEKTGFCDVGCGAGLYGGGILLASRNAPVSPSPPFSAGRLGASRSPPHEAPAAGSRSGAGLIFLGVLDFFISNIYYMYIV